MFAAAPASRDGHRGPAAGLRLPAIGQPLLATGYATYTSGTSTGGAACPSVCTSPAQTGQSR